MTKKMLSKNLKIILLLLIIILLSLSYAKEVTIDDNDLNELNKTIAEQQLDVMILKSEKIALNGKIDALQTIYDDSKKRQSEDFWFKIALTLALAYAAK